MLWDYDDNSKSLKSQAIQNTHPTVNKDPIQSSLQITRNKDLELVKLSESLCTIF
jgi:hypothetical protein